MTFDLDKLVDPAKSAFADLAVDVLGVIHKIVAGATSANAGTVLTVLRVLLRDIEEAYVGKVTPEQARKSIEKLYEAIAENDARADEALKRRFQSDPE